MVITYPELIKRYYNIDVTASDPMDYTTIVWETEETHVIEQNDENGTQETITKTVPITPIPESDILDNYKDELIDDLDRDTNEQILSGFESSALGSPHHYDAMIENQINIIGAVLAGTELYYSCTDQNGIKDMRLHTAEQIKQVFTDGVTYKQTLVSQFYQKRDAFRNASTLNELVALL